MNYSHHREISTAIPRPEGDRGAIAATDAVGNQSCSRRAQARPVLLRLTRVQFVYLFAYGALDSALSYPASFRI